MVFAFLNAEWVIKMMGVSSGCKKGERTALLVGYESQGPSRAKLEIFVV